MKCHRLRSAIGGSSPCRVPQLLLVVMLFMAARPAVLVGQVHIPVPLHFADSYGYAHTIVFGIDSKATYGFDAELDEMPVPPVPSAAAFDVRFLDPEGRKQYPYEGAYKDFRPYLLPSQRDTFFIKCQPAAGYAPMTVTWSRDATRDFEQVTMVIGDDGVEKRIDMIRDHRVQLSTAGRLMVIARGPRQRTR